MVTNIKTNTIKVKICITLPRHKKETAITKIRPVLSVIKPRSYMESLLRKSCSFQIYFFGFLELKIFGAISKKSEFLTITSVRSHDILHDCTTHPFSQSPFDFISPCNVLVYFSSAHIVCYCILSDF